MRAIRLSRFGRPAEVLRLEEVPVPEPRAGQVRLRLTHRPINPSDLLTVAGIYPVRPTLPGSPGLEGVGRVEALGPGVTGVAVGQRAVTLAGVPGTWAEYMVVPADRVLPVPELLSDQTAAQLLVNPFTAYAIMTDELALSPGDWLLQTAAGSALGRMILQLAQPREIRTINVVRSRAQASELLALGADAVIATDEEALVDRVMALTEGRGVRAAIEAVGGPIGGELVRCLAPGGVLLTMGLLGGDPLMPVPSLELVFKGASVRGFWLTLWFQQRPPHAIGRAVEEVMTLLADGRLDTPVEAEYDLGDMQVALAHVERRGRRGKVLLRG